MHDEVDKPGGPDAETRDLGDGETGKALPKHRDGGGPPLPKKIGHYSIKRVIASGGMGTVYLAQQEQPRRTVALKIMKSGLASRSALRRFEYESQTLARLRHPNIAQVYEAGTHDDGEGGTPYFAMEYIVNAKTIIEYVKAKKLETRERLELFTKVCDAVHHGHQKGIIHRDLKPGNILVDSRGEPKIIDFGVARATDSDMAVTTLQTDIGQIIGTLQYMSPEQCEADPHDLDTRSDVYALGVVLYELLTEQLPYDITQVALHEAARMIREATPARMSSFNKTLRGDIETITIKALEKDRERRYESASDVARDITRYINHEPIEARPPSFSYLTYKFLERNRRFVTVSLALVLIASASTYIAKNIIQREREKTRQLTQLLEAGDEAGGGFRDTIENRIAAQNLASRVISLDFNEFPFKDALNEIALRADLDIAPEWTALSSIGIKPTDPITLQLPSVSAVTALTNVLTSMGDENHYPRYELRDGLVIVTSEQALSRRTERVNYDVSELIARPESEPEIDETQVLGQLVDLIYGTVDPDSWLVHDGETGTINVVDHILVITTTISNHRKINHLLDELHRDRALTAGDESAFAPIVSSLDAERDQLVAKRLSDTEISVDFSDTPLEAAFDEFAKRTGLTIVVRWPELEVIGFGKDSPVTLTLPNISAVSVLDSLLILFEHDYDGLEYMILDGVIIISSDEGIRRQDSVTRAYNIASFLRPQDLVSDRTHQERIDQIVGIIQELVDPIGWRDLGGETGTVQEFNDLLLITNTKQNHRQISVVFELMKGQALASVDAARDVRPPHADGDPSIKAERESLRVLRQTTIDVNFDHATDEEILQQFRQATGLVFNFFKKPLGDDQSPPPGLTLDLPPMSAFDALTLTIAQMRINGQHDLTYDLFKGTVIFWRRQVSAVDSPFILDTRMYDISRWLPEDQASPDEHAQRRKANRFVTLIVKSVDPFSWHLSGGDIGSIYHFDGRLIISTLRRNHLLIEELLDQLAAHDDLSRTSRSMFEDIAPRSQKDYARRLTRGRSALGQQNWKNAYTFLLEAPLEARGWEWDQLSVLFDSSSATFGSGESSLVKITLDPTGRLLAALDVDGIVQLWNFPTRSFVRYFYAEPDIDFVSFGIQSPKLIMGTRGYLRGRISEIWNLEDNQLVYPFDQIPEERVLKIGDRAIATEGRDKSQMFIRRLGDGELLYQLELPDIGWFASRIIRFASDLRWVMYIDNVQAIVIHDLKGGQPDHRIENNILEEAGLYYRDIEGFTSDSRHLLFHDSQRDGPDILGTWNLQHQRLTTRQIEGDIENLIMSPTGRLLMINLNDRTALHRIDDLTEVATLRNPSNDELEFNTKDGVFSQDDSIVVALATRQGLPGQILKAWSTETGDVINEFIHPPGGLSNVSITPDGRSMVAGATDGFIRLWSLADRQADRIETLMSHEPTRGQALEVIASLKQAGIEEPSRQVDALRNREDLDDLVRFEAIMQCLESLAMP